MALTEKQYQKIREELLASKRPLIFFHDDADGLSSFLLFYKFAMGHAEDCKGIIIKTTPKIDSQFLRKVEEYNPDRIFIVDIAIVEQEFLDSVKVPVIWVDHHQPLKRDKVQYYNPRVENQEDNIPVSFLAYKIVQENIWISMIGSVGDWFWPDFAAEFKEKYPDLIGKEINDPETALFETKIGMLVDVMSFCMKGTTSDAMKFVRIWTRIKTPYEILNQETPAGKYIYKRYEEIHELYKSLRDKALKHETKGNLMVFSYMEDKMSFTKEIANEFLHRFPNIIIIIAREKSGEMKMSIRSKKVVLTPVLEKALVGIDGFGGGHEYACGANIKKKDFEAFIENFKRELKATK